MVVTQQREESLKKMIFSTADTYILCTGHCTIMSFDFFPMRVDTEG